MITATRPPDESERLQMLRSTGLLDSEAEAPFELDARSDVWSLGCIGYEMLTGELAFEGDNVMQVFSRILLEDATPIAELVPSVPCEIAAIVTRCMARDPNARYPDANALMIALRDLV